MLWNFLFTNGLGNLNGAILLCCRNHDFACKYLQNTYKHLQTLASTYNYSCKYFQERPITSGVITSCHSPTAMIASISIIAQICIFYRQKHAAANILLLKLASFLDSSYPKNFCLTLNLKAAREARGVIIFFKCWIF